MSDKQFVSVFRSSKKADTYLYVRRGQIWEELPESLLTAITAFEASQLYRKALGDGFVDYLCRIRRAEWERYHLTVSDWEQREYFGLY